MPHKTSPHEMWDQWVYASIAKHFADSLTATAPVHVEGQARETGELGEWFEVRIDGPTWDQHTKGSFTGVVTVDILVTALVTSNAYRTSRLCGLIQQSFVNDICAYRYGDDADDLESDGSRLGVLTLSPAANERVVTSNFGRIKPETQLHQATVEGRYRIQLERN